MSTEVSHQPDWRSVEYRRALILSLRDACKALTPFLHNTSANDASGKSGKEILMDMEIPEVEQVVRVLENILLHGIKIREFQQIIPLWGLLERLEVITNPSCIALRNTVGAVASCSNQLRNPLGKARGWIRQSLNAHNLDESVQFMINQPTWLNKFYYPEAILRVKADAEMLLAVMRSLKIYSFSLLVDDPRLNELPLHLTRMVSLQSNYYPPTSSSSNNNFNSRNVHASNSSSSGGFFDAFLRSFEIGFDNFVSQVDQLISTPIVIPVSLKNQLQVLDNSPPTTSNTLTSSDNSYQTTTPMPPFFGSSLRQLIMDERRCAHANLDPYLGIPTQALRMINFLLHHASAPHLFRTRASINGVEEMKKMLEQEKALQQSSMNIKEEIAVVSTVFIIWLSQLPEPLFGYDHYHAILACENLEDPVEKLQVLKLLLCDTPWYYKPLLVRLFSFWRRCLQPEIMLENGLNSIALALIATPICLRPPPGDPIYDASTSNSVKRNNSSSNMIDTDAIVMSITAAGSGMIQFIVEHAQELIIEPFHNELSLRQNELSIKWQRIRVWQQELLLMIDWKKFLAFPQGEKTLSNMSLVGTSNNHNVHNLKLPAAGEDDAVEDMLQLGADEDALLDDSHDNTDAHAHYYAYATRRRRSINSDAANEEMFDISTFSSDTRLTPQKGITRPRRSFSTSSNGPISYFSSTGNPVTGISYIGHRRQEEIDIFVRRLWKELRPVQVQLLSTTTASRLYEGSTAMDSFLTASHSSDQLSVNINKKSDTGQVEESNGALEIDESNESDCASHMTRIMLFQDTRWVDCAFTLSHQVLQDCGDVHGGYVALKCLVLFMETFPDKAPAMALEFAQARRRFCSMPQVAVKLVHFVSEVLSLAQSTAFATKTIDSTAPLGHLARQPSWPLLTTSTYTSEYGTFGELFNLAFFIFDDIWRGQCEILHEPLSLEVFSQSLYHTRSILWELILQRPNTIPKLWEIWANNVRLAQVERLYALKRKQAVQQRPLGQLTAQYTAHNSYANNNNTMTTNHTNNNNSSSKYTNTTVVGTATIVNKSTNNVNDNSSNKKYQSGKEMSKDSKQQKAANNKSMKAVTTIVSPTSDGTGDEESLVDLSLDLEDVDEDESAFRDDRSFSSSSSSSSSSGSSNSYESVTNDEGEEEEEGFDQSEGFETASFITHRDHADVNNKASDNTNELSTVINKHASEMETMQHNGPNSHSDNVSSISSDPNLNKLRRNSNVNNDSVKNTRRNSFLENSTEPALLHIDLRTKPLVQAEDSNRHSSSSKSDSELFDRLVTGRGIHTVVTSATAEAVATATQQRLFRHNTSEFHNHAVDIDNTLLHPEVPVFTPAWTLQKSEDPSATTTVVSEKIGENDPTTKDNEVDDVPLLDHNQRCGHVYIDDPHNEVRNRVLATEAIIQELNEVTAKTHPLHHITTQVKGSSKILSLPQILALEMKLPQTLQCYDWHLVYRLSIHGASLSTLYEQAQRYNNMVLVVQENTPERAIFGAVITDNLKVGERDKYYGNGSMALFSMYHPEQATNDTGLMLDNASSAGNNAAIVNNNTIRYYPWSYKNSYFLITCRDYIAVGGGGHFGLYLDSDLFRGSSGQSATFQNTSLSSMEDFSILACELYSLQAPNRS